jgi:putative membrane protein
VIAHTSPAEHIGLILVGATAVAFYGLGWLHTPDRPFGRMLCWAAGITTVLVATAPAVEQTAQRTFTGHMVQHLLLIVVAAPLLVFADPVGVTRRTGRLGHRMTPTERAVARRWRSSAAFPAAALFLATLYLTHLTPMYDAALTERTLHDVEHIAYLGSAIVLWAALRSGGRRTAVARTGAVFAVIGGSALLGMVLLTASAPLVPAYASQLGDAALADQRRAASLMWVGGMATTLPLLILGVWSWATAEQRIAERSESLSDAHARSTHDMSDVRAR